MAHSKEKKKQIKTAPEEADTGFSTQFKSTVLDIFRKLNQENDVSVIINRIEIIKRNQVEILELKSTITEI